MLIARCKRLVHSSYNWKMKNPRNLNRTRQLELYCKDLMGLDDSQGLKIFLNLAFKFRRLLVSNR